MSKDVKVENVSHTKFPHKIPKHSNPRSDSKSTLQCYPSYCEKFSISLKNFLEKSKNY